MTERRIVLDTSSMAVCAGMAALWICLQASGFYPLSALANASACAPDRLALYHLAYTCALITLAIGAGATQARLGELLDRRVFAAIAGACGVAGHALLFLSNLGDGFSPVVATGTLLVAAFVVAMVLLWSWRLAGNEYHRTMLYLALSYLMSQFASVLYFAFNLPQGPLLIICSALCAGCAMALGPGNMSLEAGEYHASPRELPWAMVIPILLLIYFCEIYIRVSIGAFEGDASVARKLITSVVAGGTFTVVAAALLFSRQDDAERVLLLTFALLATAYLVALIGMLVLGQAGQYVTNRVLIACSHCVEVLLWMVLLNAVNVKRISPITTFSLLIIGAFAIPWALSFDAFYLLGIDALLAGSDVLTTGSAVGLAVAAVSTIALLLRYALRSVPDSGAVQAQDALAPDAAAAQDAPATPAPRSVREVLAPFALTNRENEVAEYLYRGYSAKRIADALFLSEASIRAHTAHIYRKMDVHSKQELISYIDEHQSPVVV